MKSSAAALFLFLILSGICTGQNPDSLKFKSVQPAEFRAAYEHSEKALLIDVREFFEYKKSRLTGAINIPSSGNLSAASDTLDRNMDYFFSVHRVSGAKESPNSFQAKDSSISTLSMEELWHGKRRICRSTGKG